MTDARGHQADAIEKDILETQDRISETVDELQGRLTPHSLMRSIFGEEGEGSDRVVEMARRNPYAVGLVGVGALWLATGKKASLPSFGRNQPSDRSRRDSPHQHYLDHMAHVVPHANEPQHEYQRRRDNARSTFFMTERGSDEDDAGFRKRLDEMGDQLRSQTSALGHQARDQGKKLANSLSDASDTVTSAGKDGIGAAQRLYGDNPVIGGLIAAAVGAVVGAVIPTTQAEEKALGGTGKAAIEKASDRANDAASETDREFDQANH